MASRIVVETECPLHGEYGQHWSGQQSGNGPMPVCQLSSRRVLDPGSFVLIEKVDGEWPEQVLLGALVGSNDDQTPLKRITALLDTLGQS